MDCRRTLLGLALALAACAPAPPPNSVPTAKLLSLPPATPTALAAPADAGATAVVRFRADATEAQIRRSLNESGARLVDGPTIVLVPLPQAAPCPPRLLLCQPTIAW